MPRKTNKPRSAVNDWLDEEKFFVAADKSIAMLLRKMPRHRAREALRRLITRIDILLFLSDYTS